jgi:Na+/proline symporter
MGCSYCALKIIWLLSFIVLCGSGMTMFLLILAFYESNHGWLAGIPFVICTLVVSAFPLYFFINMKKDKDEDEEFDDDDIK